MFVEERRQREGGDAGGGKREVRVDDRAVLRDVIRRDQGGVETGPVHPQKDSTCERTRMMIVI